MLYAIVALLILVADQAVKYWVGVHIELDIGEKDLIPGVLHLTRVHNTGAAFSFLEGARWFFVILCLVFVAAVIILLATGFIRGRAARWMAVLVIAGGLGNCIDRIVSGYVVDMFEFSFTIFGWQFPVFNVADIFITLGIILFCVIVLVQEDAFGFDKMPETKKAAVAGGATVSPKRARDEAAPLTQIRTLPAQTAGAEIDPGDPFAAWDSVGSRKSSSRTGLAAKRIEESIHRQTGGEKTSYVMRTIVGGKTSEDNPVRPTPPNVGAPAQSRVSPSPSYDEESYDLEDILAEFRDL